MDARKKHGTEGLRERKKRETRRHISRVATKLFAERGFDAVTVAEVAAAANVAEKTVFNHFETKEELVFVGREEADSDMLDAVRDRGDGESISAAVRRHTLLVAERMQALPAERRLAFRTVIQEASSVRARWREILARHEDELARAIAEEVDARRGDVTPRVLASVFGVVRQLAFCNMTGWPSAKRKSAAEIAADIEAAFDLLEAGLRDYGIRRASERGPSRAQRPRGER